MKRFSFKPSDIVLVVLAVILVIMITQMNALEPHIYRFFNVSLGNIGAFDVEHLTWQFLNIATLASLSSLILGSIIGLLVQTELGKDFRVVIEMWASIIRAFPQIAMLRFVIPLLGLGVWPTVVALSAHGILPIVLGIISGIENVPKEYVKVSRAMGMTKRQSIFRVQIPLALPVIVSGLRVAIISCIGGATLGSLTGAEGLGLLLSTGQESYNIVLIFECAAIIGLMSIVVDKALRRIENALSFD